MIRVNIKSNYVLIFLTILSIGALIIVENVKKPYRQKWYDDKLAASVKAEQAREKLKEYRVEKGIFIDMPNDPFETTLIGQKNSPITTDEGFLESKSLATNPNFAAVVVDMFKEAGLKEGDCVAIAVTGSFPGMNIAVIAAAEQLKLKPVEISSVGSSNWGANDPYFTWLDMEKVLDSVGVFHTKSVAASLGGGEDLGRKLSPEGRKMLMDAIERNNVEMIYENSLSKSIEHRMQVYEKYAGQDGIKAFINVGGGVAAIGSSANSEYIPTGLTMQLPMKNFPVHGVLLKMAEKHVPIIHLLNLKAIAKKYGLPENPETMPKPGTGEIFQTMKYDFNIVLAVTIAMIIIITIIIILDKKSHVLGTEIVQHGNINESTDLL